MSTFIKYLIITGVIIAVLTSMSLLIPQQMTSNINGAFIYFLTALAPLGNLLPITNMLICMQILMNYIYAVCLFYISFWIVHLVSK